jgi:hypothetical protein
MRGVGKVEDDRYWCCKHFAAPILIDRSMTNYWAGVSGNGNRIKSKMAAK